MSLYFYFLLLPFSSVTDRLLLAVVSTYILTIMTAFIKTLILRGKPFVADAFATTQSRVRSVILAVDISFSLE